MIRKRFHATKKYRRSWKRRKPLKKVRTIMLASEGKSAINKRRALNTIHVNRKSSTLNDLKEKNTCCVIS